MWGGLGEQGVVTLRDAELEGVWLLSKGRYQKCDPQILVYC